MTAAKSKTKLKMKSKAKSKLKPKSKLKSKPKPKKVIKKKTALKKSKSKPKVKKTTKPKSKPKKFSKSKSKNLKISKISYTDEQKKSLLEVIEKIINSYKNKKYGLGTLDAVDHILDKYNQHYRTVSEKFDAIAEYGMQKDPVFIPKSVFVFENTHIRHEDELFKLLEDIWDGKVGHGEAFTKLNEILALSQSVRKNSHE